MGFGLIRGRYRARLAGGAEDVAAAQRLRHRAFHGAEGLDQDRFDGLCEHLLVEDVVSGDLVACCRVMILGSGADINLSYTSQYYDLSCFLGFKRPLMELGRFCIAPGWKDGDILRVLWGALTRIVDGRGVEMMFGCSSFAGTDMAPYGDALAMLRARAAAPDRWRVGRGANGIFLPETRFDPKAAMAQMPPLLRTYLLMGGWVSDHAVVDPDMGTLHVFTGLEIAAIPEARKRALRAVAGSADGPVDSSVDGGGAAG